MELRKCSLADLEGLKMKVLVTGSHGYIGTVLVPMLQQKNHDVVGADTDLYQRCTFTGQVPDLKTFLNKMFVICKRRICRVMMQSSIWPDCPMTPWEIIDRS